MPDNAKNQEFYKPGGKLFELRRRKGSLKYFYLDGKLHKLLTVNRGLDVLSAWLFDEFRLVKYPYGAVKNKMEQGFYTKEVAAMLNRHRVLLNRLILSGDLRTPSRTRNMDKSKDKIPGWTRTSMYIWSEDDIMFAHEYFSHRYLGAARTDGAEGTVKALPSKVELRAMMKNQQVMYTQTKDGAFIPVWKQVEW